MPKFARSRRRFARAGLMAAAFALFVTLGANARAGTELIMFEESGCGWCEAWKEQIGPIYPKTEESKILPLRMESVHAVPEELDLAAPVMFTPTFVAVKDGKEIGRIIGFQSEDFFWWYLADLAKKARAVAAEPTAEAGAQSPASAGDS